MIEKITIQKPEMEYIESLEYTCQSLKDLIRYITCYNSDINNDIFESLKNQYIDTFKELKIAQQMLIDKYLDKPKEYKTVNFIYDTCELQVVED